MQPLVEIRSLDAAQFRACLDDLLGIYSAAMRAPSAELPGRRAVMELHSCYPAFSALAVTPEDATRPVAFTYGFRGEPGQWWHDLVRSAVTAVRGPDSARQWLSESFEVAEVHVHPDHQACGIGKRMLLQLAQDRRERTAMLSTRDAESPARRLYRKVGFRDLLAGFMFPGTDPPYAVMGAELPLRDPARDARC